VFGSYSRIEPVRGILVPIHPTAKVFAWRAGVVDALYVAEGQSVQKGQKLATVKAVPADRDGLVYTQEGAKSLSNEEALAWQRVDLATGKGEADLQRLRATVAGALRQHAQLKAQVAFQAELIVSAQTTYEQLKTLLEKGFVSKWTCNGFVPVTYLIMPPWPRMRAG
jgi:membrane fusion protein